MKSEPSKVKVSIWDEVWAESPVKTPLKAKPPGVSSSPQKNLPVVASQPRAWLSASQSVMATPVALSVSLKLEILAMLAEIDEPTYRSPDTKTSDESVIQFEAGVEMVEVPKRL